MSGQEYTKLTHEEHVLQLPDTYIGDIEQNDINIWFYDDKDKKMTEGEVCYIPGEYKLFDEIIVNSLDQYIRLKESGSEHQVKNIKIWADQETGTVSVYNDGEGIPSDIHSTENKYIIELIFGDLLTSSNYNKNDIKHVGGKNGYGAKIVNIFSTKFEVESVDFRKQKKCSVVYYDNKSRKDKLKISNYKSKPYTKITYTPDYKRFKSSGLTDDMIKIMKKRAYDLTCCTDRGVTVYFNDEKLESKHFEKYVDLYIGPKKDYARVYDSSERWEMCVALSPKLHFEQISFVNGIYTGKGGKHVDYITNQITKKLCAFIQKKNKINIKPSFVKENIIVFLKCVIDNPSFDSQTKEYLTTNKEKFGSTFEISNKFIDNLAKTGIIERALELSSIKDMKKLKKNDGKKQNRIRGIPKLEDANFAGGKKSEMCTLIITEGDSAKSTAMSGLDIVGRDLYGVFPLKGKMLNVRDAKNFKKISENEEIKNLITIMGLKIGEKYKDRKHLRYGKIMCLTDQDEDGSHIKGLLFNLFDYLWPDLFSIDGFSNSMLTPLIKVTLKGQQISFYTISDFKLWEQNNSKKYTAKYYKGLGTSTSKEAKEYFKELKIIKYKTTDKEDKEAINMAFGKHEGSSDIRKKWLSGYIREETLDYKKQTISIEDFINKDLMHFSNSDNIRSIPSLVDGLKPSQRKVIYGTFKKNIKTEIKVAQLASAVSELSAYHHGEVSLQGTIVNMAQDFVGSNNLPLMEPIGQFGTRIMGGKDAAQPRYIYTNFQKHTLNIFMKEDEPVYNYLNDEGKQIEPEYYVPTIPIILVNGSQGIGTGWSTDIPPFNPCDIIKNIERYIDNKSMIEMVPYYYGFKGSISKIDNTTFKTKGIYKIEKNKITITELPVGMWSQKYKDYIETLVIDSNSKNKTSKQFIKYYNTYCTDIRVHFELFIDEEQIQKMNIMDWNITMTKLEKQLKLCSMISLKNMVLYDKNNSIKKYDSVLDIIEEYSKVRIHFYKKRKIYMITELNKKINLLDLKIRFINEFINETITVIRTKKADVYKQLSDKNYPKIDGSYDYVLKLPIDNLTEEKIEELEKNCLKLKQDLEHLNSKTESVLWKEDLKIVKKNLEDYGYDLSKKKLKIVEKK